MWDINNLELHLYQEDDLLSVFDRIGKNAQAKGLTDDILEELLVDES